MIRIAIVEDNQDYAEIIREYLTRYESESGESIQCVMFEDGADIVEGYRAQYDIILMDVEMKFMDGMSAAEAIRQVDEEVTIIFITNMAQYAIKGYSVNALDYILKPVSYFTFSQRIDRAIGRLKKKEKHYVVIKIRGGSRKLVTNDIFYIESQGHSLIFHTKQGIVETQGTMKSMEQQLESLHFCRCNNGYLVNLEHVEGIREGLVKVGEDFLPISRPKKKVFQEKLAAYMSEVMF
ncbi:MAG: LytTR family DNA-binding domain-containing protein [Lachnospiraceae bacterium]|nr:LytTR family DNA-binding domain-containing protein [Lachnospiraceae bacterium]